MLRPNRASYAILLGLAVVIGCSKKKVEPDAGNPDPSPSASNGTPNKDQANRGNPRGSEGQNQSSGSSRVFGSGGGNRTEAKANEQTNASSVSTPRTQPQPGDTTGDTPTSDMDNVTTSSSAGAGKVELIQCRFDRVEAALSAAKGKVVFVDCWARWCPPCIQSYPKLVEKHVKYGSKGLVCMSVSLDSGRKAYSPDQVLNFLKDQKSTLQNYYLTDLRSDNDKMEARFGRIEGIPHAVLFNKKGEKIWEGHPMTPSLISKIEAELAR